MKKLTAILMTGVALLGATPPAQALDADDVGLALVSVMMVYHKYCKPLSAKDLAFVRQVGGDLDEDKLEAAAQAALRRLQLHGKASWCEAARRQGVVGS